MSLRHQAAPVLVSMALLAGVASSASADAIAIRSGTVDVSVIYDESIYDDPITVIAAFDLKGSGFRFRGEYNADVGFPSWQDCVINVEIGNGCRASAISPFGTLVGSGLYGDLTFRGTTYRDVSDRFSDSALTFVPSSSARHFILDPSSSITGFRDDILVFPSHAFRGQGTFTFLGVHRGEFGPVARGRYEFLPTPEPATVVMCMTGCAVILRRRRRSS